MPGTILGTGHLCLPTIHLLLGAAHKPLLQRGKEKGGEEREGREREERSGGAVLGSSFFTHWLPSEIPLLKRRP